MRTESAVIATPLGRSRAQTVDTWRPQAVPFGSYADRVRFTKRTPSAESQVIPRSKAVALLNQSDLNGKSLALVLVADDGTAVVAGSVHANADDLVFEHGGDPSRFVLPDDAIERIRPVAPEVSEILKGADYFLSLSVGNHDEMPDGKGERTELKWPGGGAV